MEISKEFIDNLADYLIKQRNFSKKGNILLLSIDRKGDISDEIVEYAKGRGIFFKFDTRKPTLLPWGEAEPYTLTAGYMEPAGYKKPCFWRRVFWRLFGWRGKTDFVFSRKAMELYEPPQT